MTSSAASDTDRARNRGGAGSSRSAGDHRAGRRRPGRWTSSSTTSGAVARMTATASSTSAASPTISTRGRRSATQLGAHAGAEQRVVVDEHDADASRRGLAAPASRPRCRRPARDVEHGGPAEAVDAPDDRLADAAAVGGDGGRVEAAAGVADEPGQLGVVGLDEHVDAVDAGVAGGVDDGLADAPRRGPATRRRAAGRRRPRPRRGCRGRPRRRRPWPRSPRAATSGRPGASCRTARPAARAPGAGRASPSAAGRRCAGSAPATAAPSRGGGRRPRPARPRGCAPPARRRGGAAGDRAPGRRRSPGRR